ALLGKQRGYEVHIYDHNVSGPKPELVRDLGGTYHSGELDELVSLAPDLVLECTGVPPVITTLLSHVATDSVICLAGVGAPARRDGSIDWLCWPRFESDACFAALLGMPGHGRFRVAPKGDIKRVTRRYRPDTLILETRFETAAGSATLIDFMPIRGKHPDCVRIVVGERGRVAMCAELILRFGYG